MSSPAVYLFDVDAHDENLNVLLIGANCEKLGITTLKTAIEKSEEQSMDLVCVSNDGEYPVFRLMDYNKVAFENEKQAKREKKKNKAPVVQDIFLSFGIQKHDLEVKAKAVKRLISKGNSVRVTLRLKGRESTFTDLGTEKINEFVKMCEEFAVISKSVTVVERDIKVTLAPISKK